MKADASAIVLKTVDLFRRRADEHGVAIDVAVPPGLEVDVDELRIGQALGNLVDNALHHTPDGGSVRVSVAVNGAHELVFSVADTGGGFPENDLGRAFDPFTRADSGARADTAGPASALRRQGCDGSAWRLRRGREPPCGRRRRDPADSRLRPAFGAGCPASHHPLMLRPALSRR